MFNWIKKLFLRKSLDRSSITEGAIDEYLKNSMKELSRIQRVANKLQTAKLVKQSVVDTMDAVREDDDEEYEEEDDLEGLAKQAQKELVSKLFSNLFSSNKADNQNFNEDPTAPPVVIPTAPQDLDLKEFAKTLTPKQKEILKTKGII